jgi:UPF0716 protein FxsA
MGVLFLLFTLIPAIELFLLIQVGKVIGAWETFFIVVATGFLGALLVKTQGFVLLRDIQKNLAKGVIPADNLIQGVLVFLGGVLLITPGFLTDIAGLLLIFPLTRFILLKLIRGIVLKKMASGNIKFYSNVNGQWASSNSTRDVTTSIRTESLSAQVIDLETYKNNHKGDGI